MRSWLLTVVFLLCTVCPLCASVDKDLDQIRQAVEQANERIEYEISVGNTLAESFEQDARFQLEIAIMCFENSQLMQEDYFNLGVYCIARHFKRYALARKTLLDELGKAQYAAVANWLNEQLIQVNALESGELKKDPGFPESLKSLKHLLRSGIR